MNKPVRENKHIVVLGIYHSVMETEMGVDAFRLAGFRASDISALYPAGDKTKEFAHSGSTKAPEGAAVGGATGLALGGTLGWLVGAGLVLIPGLGAIVAAGPILGALAGVGAGGTLGAIVGALVGLDIPEYEAKRYEGRVKEGGVLVSVHCDDPEWEGKAKNIFRRTNAADVSSTTESRGNVDAGSGSGNVSING